MKTHFFADGEISDGLIVYRSASRDDAWRLLIGDTFVMVDRQRPPVIKPYGWGGDLKFGVIHDTSLISNGEGVMMSGAPNPRHDDHILVRVVLSGCRYFGSWETLKGEVVSVVKGSSYHGRLKTRVDDGLVLMSPDSVLWITDRTRNKRVKRGWVIKYNGPDQGPVVEETPTAIKKVRALYAAA